MSNLIKSVESKYTKSQVVVVNTGDTVRVHQKIKEGNKERIQIFEGLVIRTSKKGSLLNTILVRRIASGVGVEKSFLLHSPNVLKIEVVKRTKVRRNYLSYMRQRTGKSARLTSVDFDKKAVNAIKDKEAEAAEAEMQAKLEEEHKKAEAKKAASEAAEAKKFEELTKDR